MRKADAERRDERELEQVDPRFVLNPMHQVLLLSSRVLYEKMVRPPYLGV